MSTKRVMQITFRLKAVESVTGWSSESRWANHGHRTSSWVDEHAPQWPHTTKTDLLSW